VQGTPPGSIGAGDVTVHLADRSLVATDAFSYFDPLTRHGGTWGEPIRGSVNVSVLDEVASPIPCATVVLGPWVDSPYTGLTDRRGQLTLSALDLTGPVTVTAARAGFSATTIAGFDAENVTPYLTHTDRPGQPPPPAPDGSPQVRPHHGGHGRARRPPLGLRGR